MALSQQYQKLLEKRVIDIYGEVNKEMRFYVREALTTLFSQGAPDVTITINSSGGDAETGLDIYDMIRFYPGKTTGVALIAAGSAACTILQACKWRTATPNSHILIHHTKFLVSWDVLTDDAKRAEFIKSKEHLLTSKQILAKRTNKDIDAILKKCDDDNWITAGEALEFGLIDQIIEKHEDISIPQDASTKEPA